MLRSASLVVRKSQQTHTDHTCKRSRIPFGTEVDYAQLHKIYGAPTPDESRYSPATCIGCETKTLMGDPDPRHVSTSFVERQNLSMRVGMRRFTRLTNGFSKKFGEPRPHGCALFFALQFPPSSWHPESYSRDAGRTVGSCLVTERTLRIDPRTRIIGTTNREMLAEAPCNGLTVEIKLHH